MGVNPGRMRLSNALWIVLLCVVWFGIGWLVRERTIDTDTKLIALARDKILYESITNTTTKRELSYAAMRGMIARLDDPYAELIEPEAAQDFTDTFAGKTGVVGLYAENREGKVEILIIFPDSPAEKAGLQVGDIILSIDGRVLDSDSDSSETGLLIRGLAGEPVSIEIQRGEQVLSYEIIRQERVFVTYRMLPDGLGYISLNAYNVIASQKMEEGLKALLAQNPTGLIWDLRDNEGGDMQAAQEIISYFIDEGLLFTAALTRDRTVQFMAKGNAIAAQIPLVVLIDGSTYSAAETTAAAIAETGRGTTIGSHTYGKGLIHATMPLREGVLLQMTIAEWLSPTGKWYHKVGVPPQIEVRDDPATEEDEILQAGVQYLLGQR